MKIKPIPTKYRDTMFRSTLEADWAATLDWYKIDWQYEPEGLELPSGELYRPDFWLPRIKTYFEVKGLHGERAHKPEELRWAVCCEGDCDHAVAQPGGREFYDPWRMVVVGETAGNGDQLKSWVPWVSTAFARCEACVAWQWATVFDENEDLRCRACAEPTVDVYAKWFGYDGPRGSLDMRSHPIRRRASLPSPQ
jgi:hypothetical protein